MGCSTEELDLYHSRHGAGGWLANAGTEHDL